MGAVPFFRADPIRRPAAQPVVPGFSGPNNSPQRAKHQHSLMQPLIGISRRRFHQRNCVRRYRLSNLNQVWSTAGSPIRLSAFG